jgi:hypothetical protein
MILLVKIAQVPKLDNIWYSTDKRMNSIWNASQMEDTGEIKFYKKRFKYSGEKMNLDISNVLRVFFSKPIPNYGVHAISFIISFLCISYTFLFLYYHFEYFLVFALIVTILYPVSLLGVKSNWIGVEYLDNDIVKRAYFSDGSYLGWEKADKESSSLYENLLALTEKTTIG